MRIAALEIPEARFLCEAGATGSRRGLSAMAPRSVVSESRGSTPKCPAISIGWPTTCRSDTSFKCVTFLLFYFHVRFYTIHCTIPCAEQNYIIFDAVNTGSKLVSDGSCARKCDRAYFHPFSCLELINGNRYEWTYLATSLKTTLENVPNVKLSFLIGKE